MSIESIKCLRTSLFNLCFKREKKEGKKKGFKIPFKNELHANAQFGSLDIFMQISRTNALSPETGIGYKNWINYMITLKIIDQSDAEKNTWNN